MAHFIARIQGQRGPSSRLGGKSSGIEAMAAGWATGAKIQGRVDTRLGDVFDVYQLPHGSRSLNGRLIATITKDGVTLYGENGRPIDPEALPRFINDAAENAHVLNNL